MQVGLALQFLLAISVAVDATNNDPIAERCPGPLLHSTRVVCIDRYASVMAPPFVRFHPQDGSLAPLDTFPDTNTSETSFDLVRNASFIVFNQARGLEILGEDPQLDHMFQLSQGTVRDGATYIPEMNVILFSNFEAETVPQSLINLNFDPPVIEDYVPDPPVYGINGARYRNATVYWAVAGGFPFESPTTGQTLLQAPGIVALDPKTNKTTYLINNYYGHQFNGPDDIAVASNGDIFFTDAWYGWAENLTANPVAPAATWRFRPSTGHASIVESSLVQPNGIIFSPDETKVYISDSGLTIFNAPPNFIPRFTVNSTGPRFLYAFDLQDSPSGKLLVNKRPLYMAHEFGVDGVQVSSTGLIIGATGTAVDILTEDGELLLQIRLDWIVNNVHFAGPDLDELWIFGTGGISRLKCKLRGIKQ